MKWELEDLSLRFTEPEIYNEISKELDETREQRLAFMRGCVERIQMLLKANGIEAEVSGRPKHIYSIYKKMVRKHLRFDQLFDIRAVRIIVDTVEHCYEVLSLVHENFTVLSKEYDDYIANPKPNGYRGDRSQRTSRGNSDPHSCDARICRTWRGRALALQGNRQFQQGQGR